MGDLVGPRTPVQGSWLRSFSRGPAELGAQPLPCVAAAVNSPSGRYRVKLWILDGWRAVTVDDRIPVDLFGALRGGSCHGGSGFS